MKAVLEFTLPDDAVEYRLASQAGAMHLVLCEFMEYLRSQCKYVDPEQRDDLVGVRATLFAMLDENDVRLE